MAVHRVFSLDFWWGDSKFSVPVGPRRGRSRMGGGLMKKIRLKPKLPTYCKIRPFFAILSMKYSFLRYFELKSSRIWHKNVFKFFKFSGTNLGWGGDKPWSKNGDKCRMGGLAKFSPDGGTPQSPPEKNPGSRSSEATDFHPVQLCRSRYDTISLFIHKARYRTVFFTHYFLGAGDPDLRQTPCLCWM